MVLEFLNEDTPLGILFKRLKEEKGVTRSAFIREFKIKGGDSMVQQHIGEIRPISLETGLTYIKGFNKYGFGVSLADIDPKLEEERIRQLEMLMGAGAVSIATEDDSDESAFSEIKFEEAKGSCGGGNHVFDISGDKKLIKENSFFSHFNVKPHNLVAIYADGDSMSDFIIDGDIVIFDLTKTDILSGHIYLIEHPAGLRIKKIDINIKGEYVLKSLNEDKSKHPDEEVKLGDFEQLKVLGQFVYRQGGWL